MPRRPIPQPIQQQVRQRAKFLCEYCHTSEQWQYVPFTVDHVLPIGEGGDDGLENLALACFHCNRRKSDQTTATDPQSQEGVPLFNPRTEQWNEHFMWSVDGLRLVGQTAVGRATIEALQLNRERIIPIRSEDLLIGRHPPAGDLVEKD